MNPRNNLCFFLVAALIYFSVAAPSSASSISFYTDQTAWAAAAGTPTTLDFSAVFATDPTAPNCIFHEVIGGVDTCLAADYFTGPLNLGPVSFTAGGQIESQGIVQNNDLQILSPLLSGPHCLNGNDCLQTSNAGNFPTANESSTAILDITPSSFFFAFGAIFNNVDAEPSGAFTMTADIGHSHKGSSFEVTVPLLSSTFMGFVSDVPIGHLTIQEIATNGLGPFTMESPSYVARSIPEPASMILIGSGLLVALMCRRRL